VACQKNWAKSLFPCAVASPAQPWFFSLSRVLFSAMSFQLTSVHIQKLSEDPAYIKIVSSFTEVARNKPRIDVFGYVLDINDEVLQMHLMSTGTQIPSFLQDFLQSSGLIKVCVFY
jgi:hypothetical protein